MFWVISVYFNLRNILSKSGTFLPGHPVYIYIYIFVQLCSAVEIFFLLHDKAPAHNAAIVCQFLTQEKCYNPLSPPVLSRFISDRLFSVPQVENEVKRTPLCDVAEIQEAVTDELKKVQKRGIFGSFSEIIRQRKSQWSLF